MVWEEKERSARGRMAHEWAWCGKRLMKNRRALTFRVVLGVRLRSLVVHDDRDDVEKVLLSELLHALCQLVHIDL